MKGSFRKISIAGLMLSAALVFSAGIFASVPNGAAKEVVPQKHYGKVAQRFSAMLQAYHVSGMPFNDEISVKAWTNLITQYDFSHAVFLQSDLDKFEAKKTKIDDMLKDGDVSFGYEVNRIFVQRFTECMNYVTNLITKNEFDYTKDETYSWNRKDAPWPKTVEEQHELWRLRIKNELLSQILGRELDAEELAKEEAKKKAETNKVVKAESKEAEKKDKKDEEDDFKEPKLSPQENLIKRYRQMLSVLTEPDEETILQRYLSSVAQAYDPHTDYMSPTSKEDFDMSMNLSLCGVGAVLSMDDGALKIMEVMPGGPMARDGRIKKGDKIIGVGQGDGPIEDILYKPMKKTIRKIRGPKNTKVVLEIIPRTDPSGATSKRIQLVRDEIKLEDQAATGRVERVTLNGVTRNFGYVKLPGFYGTMDKKPNDPEYRSCTYDIAKYIGKFNEENSDGMILDLRGNGGGSLREAILLTALFVRPSPVVQIRDKRDLTVVPTFPEMPTYAYHKPVVVLIDRASASASEIVAGALKDTGRAIIIGDKQTHGKGTVQTVVPVGPETFGSMKVTTARFYCINGSSTQVKGVSSDIHLPSALDGMDIGEDKLPNALPWTQIEPAQYMTYWDFAKYFPVLKKNSELRLKDNEEYAKHMKIVDLFHETSERKSLPLERNARKKLMLQDRELRKHDNDDDSGDGDSATLAALEDSEKGKDSKDDVVLQESFNILSDFVEMTKGADAPDVSAHRPIPAWLRALGGN